MRKNLIIFGTHPEVIKMAPLAKEFEKHKLFETCVCVTAQHREMLDQILEFFDITPQYDLDLMKKNYNLHSLTSDIIIPLFGRFLLYKFAILSALDTMIPRNQYRL